MNILPHKSWHVRTKKNIARVRKDEAEAAEKEKEKQRRIQLAAQESRTSFLRARASQRVEEAGEALPIPLAEVADLTQRDGHINFFQDLEAGMKLDSEVNKEHEEEKKKEKEDYEKKIGCLVYLGQNTLEQTKERPWYETQSVARPSASEVNGSTSGIDSAQLKMTKFKEFEDPLKDIRKSLASPGVKKIMAKAAAASANSKKRKIEASQSTSKEHKTKKEHKSHKSKKHKSKKSKKRSSRRKSNSSQSEGNDDTDSEDEKKKRLDLLRAERLQREREERRKAEKLLAALRGDTISEESTPIRPPDKYAPPPMKQKYNSQFNPHLARQNYDD